MRNWICWKDIRDLDEHPPITLMSNERYASYICRAGDKSCPAIARAESLEINIPNRRRGCERVLFFFFPQRVSEIQFTEQFFRGRTSRGGVRRPV